MKKALIALVVALCLCTLPVLFVIASPSPATNIKIWPVGTTESEEPVVTTSPVDMMIYVTAYEQRIQSAWVLLVINQETYDGLDHVDVAGVNYYTSDFNAITENKVPPKAPDGDYPGCDGYLQYATGAVKDWVDATGEDAYYAIKEVFDYIIDDTPVYFTITHYGTSTEFRILVLALGREVLSDPYEGPFNNKSSFSGSTLIVPELATILLATASLSVFGLYKLKHKK
jgi:hypothetical protein